MIFVIISIFALAISITIAGIIVIAAVVFVVSLKARTLFRFPKKVPYQSRSALVKYPVVLWLSSSMACWHTGVPQSGGHVDV